MTEGKPITNNLLKGVMTDAMVNRGRANTDLAEVTTPGIYEISPYYGATGFPPEAYQYGILEVFASGDFLFQRYTTHRLTLYSRCRFRGVWGAWVHFINEVVTAT